MTFHRLNKMLGQLSDEWWWADPTSSYAHAFESVVAAILDGFETMDEADDYCSGMADDSLLYTAGGLPFGNLALVQAIDIRRRQEQQVRDVAAAFPNTVQ